MLSSIYMLTPRNQFEKTLFYFVLTLPGLLQAEFICNSDLSYTWTDSDKNKNEVFFAPYQERGNTEEEAKQALLEKIQAEKAAAQESCIKSHESLTDCVSGKFLSNSSLFQSLSFGGRKALEAAINDDCRKAIGRCNETTNSEIKCAEKIAPGATTSPTPSAETKSEKKGKK